MSARRESPPIIITPRPEEKPTEEPEQPIAPTPRKSSAEKIIAGILAVIIVIAVIAGIFSSGDKNAESYAEEIELRLIHHDNFSDSTRLGEYRLSEGYGYRKNGKFIINAKETTFLVDQIFTSDNIVVKFTVKKNTGDGQSAFGCSIEDGTSKDSRYPLNLYDGSLQIFLKTEDGQIYHGGMETGELYTVEVTRTVEDKTYLSFRVNGKYKEISYSLPSRKNKEISLYFISENDSEFEVDDIEIYTA